MTSILRQFMAARPFRPFRIVLTGGSEVPVTAPDRIEIRDDDETADIVTPDGYRHICDLNHLVEIRS